MIKFLKTLFCRHSNRSTKVKVTTTEIHTETVCKKCGKAVSPLNPEEIRQKCLAMQAELRAKEVPNIGLRYGNLRQEAYNAWVNQAQQSAQQRMYEEFLSAVMGNGAWNSFNRNGFNDFRGFDYFQDRPFNQPTIPPKPKWCIVLDVEINDPLENIEKKYRIKASKAHPDHGGSAEEMSALNAAIKEARKFKETQNPAGFY